MSFRIEKLDDVEKVLRSTKDTETVGKKYMVKNPDLCYIRTYDGTANNLVNPTYGQADTILLRKSASAYGDGSSTLANRSPTPREISNAICKSTGSKLSGMGLSNMVWVWGQFLDHEIDLTTTLTAEPANMVTPSGDVYPGRTILFDRSIYKVGSDPREQINTISSFIDATNVYGTTIKRANALRKLDGTGELKTSVADNAEILLPYNVDSLDNAAPTGSDPTDFFLAGDIRANENVVLTAIHTLFVREHNRICKSYRENNPTHDEEIIFQYARRKIIAMVQHITYEEFLPALLGNGALATYSGYDKTVDPGIATEFSTAGYRLGHSMLSSNIDTGSGTILLKDAFFSPSWVQTNGIDGLLKGAATTTMQEIDNEVIDDIRDFLFGPPTGGNLLDLASLNIQRGRDHGLPDYNTMREAYGLTKYTSIDQITADTSLRTKLSTTYADVDSIDPWIGMLCETHLSGKSVGELLNAVLKDQFQRLRDGDRLWWENDVLMESIKPEIRTTKLSDIINRNTSLKLKSNVFFV